MQKSLETPKTAPAFWLPELTLVEELIQRRFAATDGVLGEICQHALEAGGKRVRPLLVILCGKMCGPVNEQLLWSAAALEMVHLASLIHDDIIDHAAYRRNRLSVVGAWGGHLAVLAGDFLFATVFEILATHCPGAVLQSVVATIQTMCQGEINQAHDRFNPDINRETYYQRIYAKTGILLECCCRTGGSGAGAPEGVIEALAVFGRELGFAYQVIDDILDYTGKSDQTGKPVWEDFHQGTVTLPLILLMEDPDQRHWLSRRLSSGDTSDPVRGELGERLRQSGSLDGARQIAARHVSRAKQALSQLPANEGRDRLLDLTERLLVRVN